MSITAIVHIYNEEYLLPFWIKHHQHFFSHVIFIDYDSTDKSVETIKTLAPEWEVRTTKTTGKWGAKLDDDEVMEIEREVSGFKIALNITDFFIPSKPLDEILNDGPLQKLHVFIVCSSKGEDNPTTIHDIMSGIERAQPEIRGYRFLHSHEDGNYQLGRHDSWHPGVWANAHIVWLGFYPWNERAIQRKLQFKERLSQSDINMGAGVQHLWPREEMEQKHLDYTEKLPILEKYPVLQKALQDCYSYSINERSGGVYGVCGVTSHA